MSNTAQQSFQQPTQQPMQVTPHQAFLGEGPIWDEKRGVLLWFAITENTLFATRPNGEGAGNWTFDGNASAAAFVSDDILLVATETELLTLDLTTDKREHIVRLEANNKITRSNDGRCDRTGGFWIGTMGKNAEHAAGAIYRFHKGELRQLFDKISIPNSICFSPDGNTAYYCDTAENIIYAVALDAEGWPNGEPEVFVDHSSADFGCDGSIVDANGYLWNARWGASEVARYAPDGTLEQTIKFPVPHCSCPALGGSDFSTLFVTTARQNMDETALAKHPTSGSLFSVKTGFKGLAEPRVLLG
jgi:sugar lactone lactonase YvrE